MDANLSGTQDPTRRAAIEACVLSMQEQFRDDVRAGCGWLPSALVSEQAGNGIVDEATAIRSEEERADFLPCRWNDTGLRFNVPGGSLAARRAIPSGVLSISMKSRDVGIMSIGSFLALFGAQFYNLCRAHGGPYEPSCVFEIEDTVLQGIRDACGTRAAVLKDDARAAPLKDDDVSRTGRAIAKRVNPAHMAFDFHDVYENEKKWLENLRDTGVTARPIAYDNERRTIVTEFAGDQLDQFNVPDNFEAQVEGILAVLERHNCRQRHQTGRSRGAQWSCKARRFRLGLGT